MFHRGNPLWFHFTSWFCKLPLLSNAKCMRRQLQTKMWKEQNAWKEILSGLGHSSRAKWLTTTQNVVLTGQICRIMVPYQLPCIFYPIEYALVKCSCMFVNSVHVWHWFSYISTATFPKLIDVSCRVDSTALESQPLDVIPTTQANCVLQLKVGNQSFVCKIYGFFGDFYQGCLWLAYFVIFVSNDSILRKFKIVLLCCHRTSRSFSVYF